MKFTEIKKGLHYRIIKQYRVIKITDGREKVVNLKGELVKIIEKDIFAARVGFSWKRAKHDAPHTCWIRPDILKPVNYPWP
jgi:hypothetical protein